MASACASSQHLRAPDIDGLAEVASLQSCVEWHIDHFRAFLKHSKSSFEVGVLLARASLPQSVSLRVWTILLLRLFILIRCGQFVESLSQDPASPIYMRSFVLGERFRLVGKAVPAANTIMFRVFEGGQITAMSGMEILWKLVGDLCRAVELMFTGSDEAQAAVMLLIDEYLRLVENFPSSIRAKIEESVLLPAASSAQDYHKKQHQQLVSAAKEQLDWLRGSLNTQLDVIVTEYLNMFVSGWKTMALVR